MSKRLFKSETKSIITIGNTFLTVQPYKLGDVPSLERRLSIYDEIRHRYKSVALDYSVNERKLFLPKSINLSKIEKQFRSLGGVIIKDIPSDKKKSVGYNMTVPPRDDIQILALDFLLGRGKYLNNKFYPRLLLSLDTGMGKTYCALAAVSYLKTRVIIIVPDNALMDRWIDEMYKITDLQEDEIYLIQGTKSVKQIKKKVKDKKVIIASHRTLNNIGTKYGWDVITELFKALKVGVKIYDEAHKEFNNILKIDLHTNTDKTIYLTATAGRSALKEDYIYKTVFSNVPSLVFTSESREENHINMAALIYDSNPSMSEQIKCKTIKGFSATKYMKYNMSSGKIYFLRAIEVVMNTILSQNDSGRILLMLGSIDMIYLVEKHLKETYPQYADDIGIYCSAVSKKIKDDTRINKRIILSTFKSLGTGVDIDDLKYVCMTEPYSSKLTASQAPGRLRKQGWYFELVDIGFADCKRQYDSRKKTLIRKSHKYKEIKM